jgi:hypothetical protein
LGDASVGDVSHAEKVGSCFACVASSKHASQSLLEGNMLGLRFEMLRLFRHRTLR